MIRITLGCDEFGADWPIEQPGEIITLLFDEEIVLPLEGWRFPEGVEQEWRNYTVRRHDPDGVRDRGGRRPPRAARPGLHRGGGGADRRRRRLRGAAGGLRSPRGRRVAAAVRRRDGAARDRGAILGTTRRGHGRHRGGRCRGGESTRCRETCAGCTATGFSVRRAAGRPRCGRSRCPTGPPARRGAPPSRAWARDVREILRGEREMPRSTRPSRSTCARRSSPCKAFGEGLLQRGAPGSIVNLSSQMGTVGYPGRAVYCASKHAVEGLTKALGVEWAPDGIRVNAVAPTFVLTPLTEPMLADPESRPRSAAGSRPGSSRRSMTWPTPCAIWRARRRAPSLARF